MTIFAIIASKKSNELTVAMEREFEGNFFEFTPGQFVLYDADSTTSEIKKKLDLSGGALGQVVVFATVGSAGWHRKDLWEWLALREGS